MVVNKWKIICGEKEECGVGMMMGDEECLEKNCIGAGPYLIMLPTL